MIQLETGFQYSLGSILPIGSFGFGKVSQEVCQSALLGFERFEVGFLFQGQLLATIDHFVIFAGPVVNLGLKSFEHLELG